VLGVMGHGGIAPAPLEQAWLLHGCLYTLGSHLKFACWGLAG
jgi:hypothetical protein